MRIVAFVLASLVVLCVVMVFVSLTWPLIRRDQTDCSGIIEKAIAEGKTSVFIPGGCIVTFQEHQKKDTE